MFLACLVLLTVLQLFSAQLHPSSIHTANVFPVYCLKWLVSFSCSVLEQVTSSAFLVFNLIPSA
uniref:Secreted protein n=1 Tax=Oryza brachyantha TaxID=4533 RepID=J3LXG2_ORYBR